MSLECSIQNTQIQTLEHRCHRAQRCHSLQTDVQETCVESNISKSPDLSSSTQTSKHFNLKLAKKSIYHKNTNTNTLELGPSKNSETSHPEHRPINISNPGFQTIKKFIDLKFMPCSIKTVPHHI